MTSGTNISSKVGKQVTGNSEQGSISLVHEYFFKYNFTWRSEVGTVSVIDSQPRRVLGEHLGAVVGR